RSNQRLEFLGDSVLQIIVTSRIFSSFTDMEEGHLTRIRATLTCEETLAAFARELDLGRHLRLGKGEDRGGGRDRDSTLCDVFEALLGAMYIDAGQDLTSTSRLIDNLSKHMIAAADGLLVGQNPKGELQEWAQQRGLGKPEYDLVESVGPDHDKTFRVDVRIGDTVYATGT
ncbi:MAG: ribonuclease III, partial [Planctomycetes bacterium]|nr:ribonuclease III [Planctomycetota bacterium]